LLLKRKVTRNEKAILFFFKSKMFLGIFSFIIQLLLGWQAPIF